MELRNLYRKKASATTPSSSRRNFRYLRNIRRRPSLSIVSWEAADTCLITCCDLRQASYPRKDLATVALSFRSRDGEQQHADEDHNKAERRRPDRLRLLRKNRETPVHKFDVHPIDQQ